MVSAMIQAAASRGEDLDGFVMDFVYPSIKGPSIEGRRVVLLDAWLSEKSYVQTSSLVTLRNGNELSLDFGIVDIAFLIVAIASWSVAVPKTSMWSTPPPATSKRSPSSRSSTNPNCGKSTFDVPRIKSAGLSSEADQEPVNSVIEGERLHAPNQISLAAKASGEPEFREIGLGPWSEPIPVSLVR